jgi:hypothetical protein
VRPYQELELKIYLIYEIEIMQQQPTIKKEMKKQSYVTMVISVKLYPILRSLMQAIFTYMYVLTGSLVQFMNGSSLSEATFETFNLK